MTRADDLCPCGSARKYKNCCIGKIKKRDFPPRVGLNTYPEEYAINGLLNNTKEFKDFYDNERINISGEGIWAEDHHLPFGTRGMTSLLPDGNNLMLLPIIPPPIEQSFMVAHELGHLLRRTADNYFYLVGIDTKSSDHASSINSMIEDHLVDSILAGYGFDLEAEYEQKLRDQMTMIDSWDCFSDEIDALTGFTNFKLCSDLIGERFKTWQELETLLESKFPDLVDGVNRLYHFIKENENDIHTSERKNN